MHSRHVYQCINDDDRQLVTNSKVHLVVEPKDTHRQSVSCEASPCDSRQASRFKTKFKANS